MDRRAYLTTLGVAAAAVSGCSGGDGTATTDRTGTDGTVTPTERATATPEGTPAEEGTPSAEPPDPSPRVTDAGLLLEAGSFTTLGDVDSVGRGGILVVGAEYELPVSDGSARGIVEVRIYDSDGTELATDSEAIDAVVTDGDFHSDATSFAFDTADQERGSYTAEVLVNAGAYGTSASTEVAADIVEPLGEGEVEMYIADFPSEPVAGEAFDWTLGFRNLTDRDTSVVTDTVTLDPAGDDPVVFDIAYRENVPAGEATQVEVADNRFSYPGSYTYRIAAIDAEVSFTIQPPEE